MSGKRITMRQIAEQAGVSVMTVSLALRNHSRIGAATRDRVKAIAQQAGYRPHPYVSALMASLKTSRHRESAAATLAFIYHFPRASLGTAPFMKSVYEGIRQRARQLGFGVDVFYRHEAGPRTSHLDRVLKARGIRGVIVGPTQGVDTKLDYTLDWPHYATGTFGFSLREPVLHRAASFTYHSVRTAYRELWARGYRRIGMVNTHVMHYRVDGNWRSGHYEGQTEHLGRVDTSAVLLAEDQPSFLRWLKRYRPDAILCNNGGEIGWLKAAGVRVPEDVGIATLSPLEPGQLKFFAGIDQREGAIGAATVDIVVEQLNTNTFGLPAVPKTVMIECTWRDGPSIRSLKPAEAAIESTR